MTPSKLVQSQAVNIENAFNPGVKMTDIQPHSHIPNLEEIRKRKANLWKALLLSAGIDIAMTFFEVPVIISTFGTELILDEVIEYFLSGWIAGTAIDLKRRNRLIGLLPIPGVTSLSVQCAKELWKLQKAEKRALEGLQNSN